jgi:phospholipid transport system substrate-binding protein
MDFQKSERSHDRSEASVYHATAGLAESGTVGLPRGLSETLADPIVMALMAADQVDRKGFEHLLRRVAAQLAERGTQDRAAPSRREPAVSTGLRKRVGSFALALAVIAGFSAGPRPAAADEAPVAFIRTLGAQAVSVIRSPMPLFEKAAYFDQLVRQDFDLTGICRFVLGPYWRISSPAERQQFCDGFADRMVRFYGRELAQSGDGDFVVTGSRTDPAGVIVTSQIVRPQAPAIAVDWRFGVSDGQYKIEDVAIDGVSMVLTERSEIATQIARDGGQVEMLLAAMRG